MVDEEPQTKTLTVKIVTMFIMIPKGQNNNDSSVRTIADDIDYDNECWWQWLWVEWRYANQKTRIDVWQHFMSDDYMYKKVEAL